MEQRSDEWFRVRLGKVTASRVADIVAKGRGQSESARRRNYRAELITERLSGVSLDSFQTAAMAWGSETEDEARAAYQRHALTTVEQIAFVDHPSIPMAGASPDGLVGADGQIELKCPTSRTQICALAEHYDLIEGKGFDPEYDDQMQWQMACTGRQWCDFVSYDPRIPGDLGFFIKRTARDEKRITFLEDAVSAFLAEVDATVAQLTEKHKEKEAA